MNRNILFWGFQQGVLFLNQGESIYSEYYKEGKIGEVSKLSSSTIVSDTGYSKTYEEYFLYLINTSFDTLVTSNNFETECFVIKFSFGVINRKQFFEENMTQ